MGEGPEVGVEVLMIAVLVEDRDRERMCIVLERLLGGA
jgi:hypothetical protein